MKQMNYKPLAAAILLGNATLAITAFAADAAVLEEVMVTATKRATSLQDTPLAISAFNQDTLTANHVTNVFDLEGMVPNLHIRESGDHNIPLIFIRGQGAIDVTEAGDSAVAFYTDGVFGARAQGSTALMYDMERVEVLRGPQGTLFGRNSTAGAMSLITAKPTQEFEASGGITAGSRNRRAMEAMVNIPLTDQWAVRFSGKSDVQDGDISYSGDSLRFSAYQKYGAKDLSSYRASSMFKPTEAVSWFLSYEKFLNQGTGNIPTLDAGDREDDSLAPGAVDLDSDAWRTRLDWDLNSDLTLSYIGGYTEFSQSQIWGSGHNGTLRETVYSTHEATQHEFQLKNSDDNRLRWTAGVFLFEEENSIRFDMPHGSWGGTPQDSADGTLSTFIQPDRGMESESLYAQGTYDITDNFRVTLGARYTDDERYDNGGRSIDCTYDVVGALPTVVAQASDLNGGQGCYVRQYNDMDGNWDNTSGMGRLEYDLSDDVMVFVSFATGWKSGVLVDGQNSSDTNGLLDKAGNNKLTQQPEENESLEIGVKSTLLNGAMTLNANLFFMTYEDMQVTSAVVDDVTGESTLSKTNAGEASMEGLEVEMNWKVSEGGLLTGSFAYLSAEYDDFIGSAGAFQSSASTFNPCVEPDLASPGACVDGAVILDGNTLPFSPEYALSLAYTHDFMLANGAIIRPRVSMSYQDEMFLTQENYGDRPAGTIDAMDPGESDVATQEAYSKFDVSVSYLSADEKWTVEGFINNVTDEEIKADSQIGAYQSSYQWAPARESGVRVFYNF
ncbi:TonB-dependent receptor [Oceanicoccus sp. KOV_DT_Chl]|uniref:TonB-dependent receptor n=1 Tax=Oceanicoccus sp. KOV_DT_Chl TaxID=1904639 RepID=UPI000C7E1491|nr:TonB-dependent receptor [Oceanicoccus sp. KOV_DT_Chl]